jgi:DNA (cytosine-5)-methyltransferase 1
MSHSKTDTIPDGWRAENGMWVIQSLTDPALQALIAYDGLVLELFAGPGGMSEGLRLAGISSRVCLGVEWDSSACMTATRAGHPRLHADLTTIDPLLFGRVWGFHASPSCQGFSFAGKGASRGDVDLLLQAITAMGREPHRADEIMATLRTLVKSPLSPLSLEPLRYILALRPRWFTLEQVRAVLPLWEAYAEVLRPLGYSVWTGIESSEKFGVPQTRERALAMGSLDIDLSGGLAQTHSRYIKSGKRKGQQEPGFLPYVTMAQALERAGDYVVRSNYGTGGEPAPTLTSSADNGNFRWVPTAANEGTTAEDMAWTAERPSATIVGSFHPDVVAKPAYRKAGDGPRQKAKGSVSITVQEAGILQSFPADYPWTGTKTKQWEQVGNAVPPLLGQALAETAIGIRPTAIKGARL